MENTKQKDEITLKITKKDKIYISIIAVLLVAIVVLAIVLPRPYRVVEVEKPVDRIVYQEVYPTETAYIISKDSALYDSVNHNYIDTNGQEYTILEKYNLIDTGRFKEMSIVTNIDDAEIQMLYETKFDKELSKEFVKDVGDGMFGIDIVITSENMKAACDTFKDSISSFAYSNRYVLKVVFEKAVVNYLVTYVE